RTSTSWKVGPRVVTTARPPSTGHATRSRQRCLRAERAPGLTRPDGSGARRRRSITIRTREAPALDPRSTSLETVLHRCRTWTAQQPRIEEDSMQVKRVPGRRAAGIATVLGATVFLAACGGG